MPRLNAVSTTGRRRPGDRSGPGTRPSEALALEELRVLALLLQGLPDDAEGQALGVALAGEHAGEAPEPLVSVEATGGPQLAGDQFAGGRLLLLGVELRDGLVDQGGVDALGAQFLGQCPA